MNGSSNGLQTTSTTKQSSQFWSRAISAFRRPTTKSQSTILNKVQNELASMKPQIENLKKRELEVDDQFYFDALQAAAPCLTPHELSSLHEESVLKPCITTVSKRTDMSFFWSHRYHQRSYVYRHQMNGYTNKGIRSSKGRDLVDRIQQLSDHTKTLGDDVVVGFTSCSIFLGYAH